MTTLTAPLPKRALPNFMTDQMFAINMFLVSIFIFSLPFVEHAFTAGLGFLLTGESTHGALNLERTGHFPIAIYALAAHMVSGAVINFLSPLQVHLGLTQKNKKLHRVIGGAVIVISFTGALVGTTFYALYPDDVGTRLMRSPSNLQAGSLFGIAMFIVTYKVVQTLIQRDFKQHRIWAISMFAMAIGSYTSRVMDGWEYLYFSNFGGDAQTRRMVAIATAWAFWLLPLAMIHGYYALKSRGMFANFPAYAPFVTSLAGVIFYGVGSYFYIAIRLF